ncbi:cupin domain-containing protein [Collimonas silvisoli]|uniref:cupin domain-containing protein n=1 Tax=Collimonas silvisoli TaxID=2825884 RepID=UPI001B8C8D5B|nr:cupin domain-containing protein [Collimonas silvisoli]
MTTATIISYAEIQPVITVRQPDPEMRVKGAPNRTTLSYFADPAFGLSSGIWSAETGAYKISMAASKHEFFHILTGKVEISCDSTGAVKSYGPGDTGIIPPGFSGMFEIIEDASKFYVVTDRNI